MIQELFFYLIDRDMEKMEPHLRCCNDEPWDWEQWKCHARSSQSGERETSQSDRLADENAMTACICRA